MKSPARALEIADREQRRGVTGIERHRSVVGRAARRRHPPRRAAHLRAACAGACRNRSRPPLRAASRPPRPPCPGRAAPGPPPPGGSSVPSGASAPARARSAVRSSPRSARASSKRPSAAPRQRVRAAPRRGLPGRARLGPGEPARGALGLRGCRDCRQEEATRQTHRTCPPPQRSLHWSLLGRECFRPSIISASFPSLRRLCGRSVRVLPCLALHGEQHAGESQRLAQRELPPEEPLDDLHRRAAPPPSSGAPGERAGEDRRQRLGRDALRVLDREMKVEPAVRRALRRRRRPATRRPAPGSPRAKGRAREPGGDLAIALRRGRSAPRSVPRRSRPESMDDQVGELGQEGDLRRQLRVSVQSARPPDCPTRSSCRRSCAPSDGPSR